MKEEGGKREAQVLGASKQKGGIEKIVILQTIKTRGTAFWTDSENGRNRVE